MDKLISIESGLQIRQGACDLVGLNWTGRGLCLDFATGAFKHASDTHQNRILRTQDPSVRTLLHRFEKSNKLIRVQFEGELAFRVVDEVLDSIDGEGVREGSNRAGFAYEVQDGAFLASYPNVNSYHPHPSGPLKQYAFISLNWCVEVLAHLPPTFHLVG
jgi:hypothetical protein